MLKTSPQTFAEQLADEYEIEFGKSAPLHVGTNLAEFDKNEAPGDRPFCELVGSLIMWLLGETTQLGETFPMPWQGTALHQSYLIVHWRASHGVLGYVGRTSSVGITFQRGTTGGLSLQVFVNADYASKAADRRSVSGGLVMCRGACVSWFSRTQRCVTLSTTEARARDACRRDCREVLFLRQVWRFMLSEVGIPCIPVFEDNQGAVQLAQNPLLTPTPSTLTCDTTSWNW